MKKSGEHIRVNFGHSPFVFDIDGMMAVRSNLALIVLGFLTFPPSISDSSMRAVLHPRAAQLDGGTLVNIWTNEDTQREEKIIKQEIEATRYVNHPAKKKCLTGYKHGEACPSTR